MPPRSGERDLAELVGIEVFLLRLQVVLAGTLLHTDLADTIVHSRGLDDRRSFFDGERQRLLDINVFPGIQRIHGRLRMPVIGRRNQNYIDGLVGE